MHELHQAYFRAAPDDRIILFRLPTQHFGQMQLNAVPNDVGKGFGITRHNDQPIRQLLQYAHAPRNTADEQLDRTRCDAPVVGAAILYPDRRVLPQQDRRPLCIFQLQHEIAAPQIDEHATLWLLNPVGKGASRRRNSVRTSAKRKFGARSIWP